MQPSPVCPYSPRFLCYNKPMRYEFHVEENDDGMRLSAFLSSRAGLSLSLVRTLKRVENGITIDGESAHTDARVKTGQLVAVNTPESECELAPCDADVPILYDGRDALVYDKPAGMAVHPTLGYPDGTLANVYAARLLARGENGAFRPINRLDRNTSGAVLAAKSRLAAPRLAKSAKKLYIAVVEGIIKENEFVVDAPIALEEGSFIKRRVHESGKQSATRIKVLARLEGHTLIEAETLTGRTHQIRVHLAHLGHPLAGDDLYGGSLALIGRHALHCREVSFELAGDRVRVRSPLAGDMAALIALLGGELPPLD